MKYTVGSIGRVLVVKVEHGDDLLEEIKNLAIKENIISASLFMLGALKKASLVVGPRECTVPPEPVWASFTDGREIMGIGSIFSDGVEPVIHLHAAFGRGGQCPHGLRQGRHRDLPGGGGDNPGAAGGWSRSRPGLDNRHEDAGDAINIENCRRDDPVWKDSTRKRSKTMGWMKN